MGGHGTLPRQTIFLRTEYRNGGKRTLSTASATTPHCCYGVFTDRSNFSLNSGPHRNLSDQSQGRTMRKTAIFFLNDVGHAYVDRN